MSRPHAVTSYEVARAAGVSQATVSTVLSGTRSNIRVSEETRQRVLAAAAALNYSPHPFAGALRRRQSSILGFIPRPVRTPPFEDPIPYLLTISITRAALRRGYHVVEASAQTVMSDSNTELIQFLTRYRVDGVILDGPETASLVQHFAESGLPTVQVMRPQPTVDTHTITVDASPGITAAIDHLVAQGHRRIAFLGSSDPHPVSQARLDCFTAALARHGLAIPDAYVRLATAYSPAEGRALARALMALPDPPTAIFAAGDNLASGVTQQLYDAHIRIPEMVSLISYDDTFVKHLSPPLTSVTQPLTAVAEQAIALITQRLGQNGADDEGPTHLVLPSHLTVRQSTRPPA